jgi:hypothetical protein
VHVQNDEAQERVAVEPRGAWISGLLVTKVVCAALFVRLRGDSGIWAAAVVQVVVRYRLEPGWGARRGVCRLEHRVLRLSLCRDCIVHSRNLELGCVSAVVVVIRVFWWVDNTLVRIASFEYLSPRRAASSNHATIVVRASRRCVDSSSAF